MIRSWRMEVDVRWWRGLEVDVEALKGSAVSLHVTLD